LVANSAVPIDGLLYSGNDVVRTFYHSTGEGVAFCSDFVERILFRSYVSGLGDCIGPSAWNEVAQNLVEEILTNPNSQCTTGRSAKQGDYVQIRLPNGMGARWTTKGLWIGFIGP
jgi:hypothetical protein